MTAIIDLLGPADGLFAALATFVIVVILLLIIWLTTRPTITQKDSTSKVALGIGLKIIINGCKRD